MEFAVPNDCVNHGRLLRREYKCYLRGIRCRVHDRACFALRGGTGQGRGARTFRPVRLSRGIRRKRAAHGAAPQSSRLVRVCSRYSSLSVLSRPAMFAAARMNSTASVGVLLSEICVVVPIRLTERGAFFSRLRTGAARQRTPAVPSSSSIAYPRLRGAASSSEKRREDTRVRW